MASHGEGEPPRLTVAVDDLGAGLWTGKLKEELETRLPLRNVPFSLSRAVVSVEELPIRFLDARGDAQLQRLRQLAHSPVAWFRSPLVHIVLTSCPEYEEYKRDLRLRLKAMADTESSAPGQPELLFVYLRPAGADPAAKGPARVFDAMRRDLNRRRERCVRLDPLPPGTATDAGAPALLGLEDFDRQLKDALRAGFEARAAAYAEEVRRLMLSRLDPSWSFSTLFLVKDGLAAMLEAAGLLEDSLKEYSELEAAYLEVLRSGQQARQPFGGAAAGEDEAALLWASWAAIRQAASQPELPPEWVMRQALFASQARLLLKLHRHAEVAERGLVFVRSFGGLLAQQQRAGGAPPQLREAWSFASYLSLAEATSRLQAARAEEKRKADTLGRGAGRRARLSEAAMQQPGSPGSGPDALPVPIPLSPSALGITSLQVKAAGSSDGDGAGSPSWRQDSPQAQMDWQLGTLPGWAAAAATAGVEGPVGRPGREGPAGGSASLYCLLGKLYCAARAELLRLGSTAGLDLPKAATAVPGMPEPRQHVLPPPAAAAGAAAPAVLPSEAAAAQQTAAAAAAAAEAAGRAGWQAEEGLPDAPSATDLAQVDLTGPATSSSEQELQAGAAGSPGFLPAPSADQAAASLKLGSAIEGQPDAQAEVASAAASGGGLPAASPRQVAPAPLQRISVRSKAAGDADSQSSSPHSASTQQSSLQHALSDVQSPDAGHAVAPHAALPPTPTAEQGDMRTAERQVLSALAERASGRGSRLGMAAAPPTPAAPAAAAADAAGGADPPPWLVHWRLRAALSSEQLLTELFIELSEAAARCYSQCGYLRNAALLRADVADALAKAGTARRAAVLYARQCRTFLREGWHALAAATLPKLAACQQAIDSPGLAHTAAAMLSLPPPFQGTAEDRQAACRLLLQAAKAQPGLGSSLPLLPGKPAAGDGGIDLSAIIAAAPQKCAVSRFFGRTGPDGAPLLAPAPREPAGLCGSQCGACRAAVGDALPLQLVVRNQLPEALLLSDVVLTLAVLQEMTVIHSPRASPRPLATPSMQGGSSQRRSSAPGTPLGDAGAHALESQESLGRERYEAHWQQVEELVCSLVAISSSASSGSSSGSSSCGGGGATLRPLTGEVPLPPGTSLLTFLAAPVQRGLYKALHLRAMLQQLPLHVEVEAPEPLWQQQEAAAAVAAAAAHSRGAMSPQALRRSSRAGVPRGGPLAPVAGGAPLTPRVPRHPSDGPAGVCDAEFVVLDVEQAQPRVQLSLVAAGGSLIAGQEQWLGLALAPERDALQHARLELTWPLASAAGGLPGLPAHSRKATGPGSMHRAAHSLGGDVRLSPAVSSAALSVATPPFLRPEHRSAVLLSPDGSVTSRDGPQVLPAEGPAGPAAAWLLTEGLQQQLELPTVAEGQPICLWWRVTAGEVSAPPEQVHIAPPAPRHSSRPLDLRRLAGLPGDSPPAPAAALDLPATLEYASGCQRSHCRVLAAPVRQPFSVASAARELPSGGVAVQFTLTSNLAVPAQLARLALQPQPGFALSSSLLDGMGLLPASLDPGASLTAAFLLVPEGDAGGPGAGDAAVLLPAKLQPSVLSVDYTIDSRQQCGVAAAALGQHASGAQHSNQQQPHIRDADVGGVAATPASQQQHAQQGHSQQQQTPGAEALELLGRTPSRGASRALNLRGADGPAAAAADDSDSEGDGPAGGPSWEPGGRQLCSFRHLITLEMPASEEGSSGTVVFVRLLGPFSATVGQPTTLCWRLERGGQPDQQLPASRISFEVQAESEHWRPLGWRQGGVTLAGHPGAVATVEATWVPLASGTLQVPELRLSDVVYQEVFDVGLSGGMAIAVAEAG